MKSTVTVSAFACLAAFACAGPVLAQKYTQTNLVTDAADAALKNPWGLSRSGSSPWWVSDNVTGMSTLYDGTGAKQQLVVTVPGKPTGTVFNFTATAFAPPGSTGGPKFLFVSLDGQISGWSTGAAATNLTTTQGAVYTGCTIAMVNGQPQLFVADFHNARIDVFDATMKKIDLGAGAFALPGTTGTGYAPYNIQNLGGTLFVAFAQQDPTKQTDVAGAGLGHLAAFSPDGKMLVQYQDGNWFNAPWGLALASGEFGYFGHRLLVGMFGSGQIAAFDLLSGQFDALLQDVNGKPIAIDGLWALSFGNGSQAGPLNTLFFTAGPNSQQNGIFGSLTPATGEPSLGDSR